MNQEINIINMDINMLREMDKFNLALSKSKDIFSFLSKDKDFLAYLDSINQTFDSFFNLNYYNLVNDKLYWKKAYRELNDRYSRHNGGLLPIFTTGISDDIICILNTHLVIIHNFASDGWELIPSEIDLNNIQEICTLFKKRNGISI